MNLVFPKQYIPQRRNRLIWACLISCLALFLSKSQIQADPRPGFKKPIYRQKAKFQQYYLELAGGYGVWSHTFQAGMAPHQSSIDISVTYGSLQSPFSLIAGYTFHTSFKQEIFLFKPSNGYAGLKFSLLRALGIKSRLDPYTLAGVTYWQGTLTDDVYDGIINYQEKAEKDYGLGGIVGVGVSYRIKKFHLGPQILYHLAGNGQYLAGGFETQEISPSYITLLLKAGYRFNFKKGLAGCPTYK